MYAYIYCEIKNMNPQQKRLEQLADEVYNLRKEAESGTDINKLFEFADKAREFEDAWIAARGKKKAKPDKIRNPYAEKKVKKSSFAPTKKKALYRNTFKSLATRYNEPDFERLMTRGLTDGARKAMVDALKEKGEGMPGLVDRYIARQIVGTAETERLYAPVPDVARIDVPQPQPRPEFQPPPTLTGRVAPRLKIPDIERQRRVDEILGRLAPSRDTPQPQPQPEPPQSVGGIVQEAMGAMLEAGAREGQPEAPSVAQVLGENVRGALQAGIDVARLPFDQLRGNFARRVMRPDLLPAPAMERRRGRGAGNWKDWIVDTIIRLGSGYIIGKVGEMTGNYLWHTIMGNTPKKNKAETEKLLKDAGIVPDGTIDDALKTKEDLEELFETYKRERRQAEAEAPPTPEVQPEAQPTAQPTPPTPEPEPTQEVIMGSEEFQRRVDAAQEVERRQRESTQTQTERDPQPPPLTRPNVQYPDLRTGHLQKIAMEQMLQLKKEEEDRRIATLYTNNPDDYMSAGVPNPYERPMYSDEWVDIKRLQRLQTPEYTRKEQEIWARNYQTPYQMGEGTVDNSVKDIKNIVERIAQLERRLRYDYATKGVPRDERQPGYNWGMPTQRMGRSAPIDVMPTEVSRYSAYLDVVDKYNMDKYQYRQRQNEPPRSKLINRDAQFGLTKPTPDIPSQQKIYDEFENENTPMLDIQNDMDYEYFRRRIRKD
ncbi:hypothetical protein OAE88_00770 [bacterium]|nr:hypothetical protein [bacterium]